MFCQRLCGRLEIHCTCVGSYAVNTRLLRLCSIPFTLEFTCNALRNHYLLVSVKKKKKMALFMERIINFQQMIKCKGVLLRKDWRIINLLLLSGLQEDGPG